MIALMSKRAQSRVAGHDVLNIPDDIVDELGVEGVCPIGFDLSLQEVQLIGDVLGMHRAYSRIPGAIQISQGAAINQFLELGLYGGDLVEKKALISGRNPSFQFVGDRIVKGPDLRKRQLPSHPATPLIVHLRLFARGRYR